MEQERYFGRFRCLKPVSSGAPLSDDVSPLSHAGNRRTTLQTFVRGALEAALSRVAVPEVALGGIQVEGATLDAYIHGEALPRRFENLSAVRVH